MKDIVYSLALHIQKGNYDNTINLDGLNVVAVFHRPGNMLKGTSVYPLIVATV
jgi:hypothetical protein